MRIALALVLLSVGLWLVPSGALASSYSDHPHSMRGAGGSLHLDSDHRHDPGDSRWMKHRALATSAHDHRSKHSDHVDRDRHDDDGGGRGHARHKRGRHDYDHDAHGGGRHHRHGRHCRHHHKVIPEPATGLMTALGLVAVALRRRLQD